MTAEILDGKQLSEKILSELKNSLLEIKKLNQKIPKLAIILVGDNEASKTYIKHKIKACEKVGIDHQLIEFDNNISQIDIETEIENINKDNKIDGFIIQLPLPKHLNVDNLLKLINPTKDVDGLHPLNLGKMALGLPCHKPATPSGILELLKEYQIPTQGKNCVVIGRSRIVGLPISILMSRNSFPGNATVTMCNSYTQNISEFTKKADIIISAVGKNSFITADMIKKRAVVIDVGINRVIDNSKQSGYKVVGDVMYEEVSKKASYITPVPGGIGPMTIALLVKNVFNAAKYNEINIS